MGKADVKIKINLKIDESRIQELIDLGKPRSWAMLQLASELNVKIKQRLFEYLDTIQDGVKTGKWKQRFLRGTGDEILNLARRNAENGYNEGEWEDRSEITKLLYELRRMTLKDAEDLYDPNNPGLTTGKDVLINSLFPNAEFNIYEIHPFADMGRFGTKFIFAELLENGGYGEFGPAARIMGFNADGSPKGWLIKGLKEKFHLDEKEARQKASEIHDEITADRYIPPRPFLKPALWSVYDEEKDVKLASYEMGKTLEDRLIRVVDNKDDIEVTADDYPYY